MSEEEFEFTQKMVHEFLDASLDELNHIENLLLDFENNPSDQSLIDNVFRTAHSIKGSAAFFKLMNIQKLAHTLENVLDVIRKGEMLPSSNVISTLLAGFIELTDICMRVKDNKPEVKDNDNWELLLSKISQLAQQKRDLKAEVSLFLNSLSAFFTTLSPKDIDSSSYKSLQNEVEKLKATLQTVDKKRQNFRKTAEFFFNKKDISGEISTLKDILTLANKEIIPITTAQRLKDALVALSKIFDAGALDIVLQMLVPIELILSGEDTFTGDLAKQLSLNFNDLRPFIAEGIKIEKAETPELIIDIPKEKEAEKEVVKASEKPKTEKQDSDKTMRISEAKVDGFIHYVGELIVISDMLVYVESEMGKYGVPTKLEQKFREANQTFHYLSQNLRESLMQIRQVPIKDLLQKMPSLARTTADKVGKKIQVTINGGDVEIDKSLYEVLNSPLVHIIRNSVDHGIEPKADRLLAGKPEAGQITIEVSQEENWILLAISDDGSGIDFKKIKNKAIEKNLMPVHVIEAMAPNEILQVLFLPGFSTAEQITDVSGRGVGLDVVKSSIEEVNGKVIVESKVGEGSTFNIKLPLSTSLLVVDGINTRVGDCEYIFPLENMQNAFQPQNGDIFQTDQKDMVKHNDEFLPIIKLFELFDINSSKIIPEEAIFIVVNHKRGKAAVMVDIVLGGTQVVIKQLGIKKLGFEHSHRAIAGGAIMGHGAVSLVLNIEGVLSYI